MKLQDKNNSTKRESLEMSLIRYICRNIFMQNNRLDFELDPVKINWQRFLELSNRNEVTPLVYKQSKQLSLDKKMPADINKCLENIYYLSAKCNILLWNKYLSVHDILKKEHIGHAPIKGLGLLYTVYKDISLHPMCDIDLMVKREDFPRLKQVMVKEGYNLAPADNLMGKKMLFTGNSIALEIHDNLYSSYTKSIHFGQSWSRLTEQMIDGKAMTLLSMEDLFLSVILHHHFFYDNLKSSLDCMLILNPEADELDWGYINYSAKQAGILSTLWYKLMLAFNAFNLPPKEEIFRRLRGRGYSYKRHIFNRVIEQKRRFLESQQASSRKDVGGAWFNFFLFDSWWRWMEYFMNKCILYLTIERFARFCSLKYPSFFTRLCYSIRVFFIPLRLLYLCVRNRIMRVRSG